jgi:hypothetical protein
METIVIQFRSTKVRAKWGCGVHIYPQGGHLSDVIPPSPANLWTTHVHGGRCTRSQQVADECWRLIRNVGSRPSFSSLLPCQLQFCNRMCFCNWHNNHHSCWSSCDGVLSHWFPMRKSSHVGVGRKTMQWRRHGRNMAQLNEDVI